MGLSFEYPGVGASLAERLDAEAYDSGKAYVTGEFVYFSGAVYRAKEAIALGEDPTSQPAKWDEIALGDSVNTKVNKTSGYISVADATERKTLATYDGLEIVAGVTHVKQSDSGEIYLYQGGDVTLDASWYRVLLSTNINSIKEAVISLRNGGDDTSGDILAYWNSADYNDSTNELIDNISSRVLTAQEDTKANYSAVVGPLQADALRIASVNTTTSEDWHVEVRAKFQNMPGVGAWSSGQFVWGFNGGGIAIYNNRITFRDTANTQTTFTTTAITWTDFNIIRVARESGDLVLYINGVESDRVTKAYSGFTATELRCTTGLRWFDYYEYYESGVTKRYNFDEGEGDLATSTDGLTTISTAGNWQVEVDQTFVNPELLLADNDGIFENLEPSAFFDASLVPQDFDASSSALIGNQVIVNHTDSNNYEIIVLRQADSNASLIQEATNKIRVPIIAFTGQSNNNGVTAIDPTNTFDAVSIHVSQAVVDPADPNVTTNLTPLHWESVKPDSYGTAQYGGSYYLLGSLFESEFRSELPDGKRFVGCLSGRGGTPSTYWDPKASVNSQWVTFKNNIERKIALLNARYPDCDFYLDCVVINQGEREVATGVDWGLSWGRFIDQVRISFGSQVIAIIETLTTNGTMVYPVATFLAQTRAHQDSLATGSGHARERSNVYLSEANNLLALNGGTNVGMTDGAVHYTPVGYKLLGIQTFGIYKTIKGF